MLLAGATIAGDAEHGLQSPQIMHTSVCRLADLLVGDGVTDADVHDFNKLWA